MPTYPKRLRWALLGLPLLLMAIGACQSASTSTPTPTPTPTPIPTPTATPTPVPTPTPVLLPLPILADPEENPLEFFLSLPREEQECAVQTLGQARLDQLMAGAEPTDADNQVIDQCLSQETVARIVMGSLVNQAGDLGDETLGCMWDALSGADLSGLFNEDEFLPGAIGALLGASTCMSDEEAARLLGAEGSEDFPIAEMRCLAERLSPKVVASIFTDGLEEALPPPDVLVALLECSLGPNGSEGDALPFTADQLACLQEALGDDALAQMLDQEGEPTLDVMLATLKCGLMTDAPDAGGLPFTASQLACLQEYLGDEALAQLVGQEGEPTLDVVLTVLECGLELGDSVGGDSGTGTDTGVDPTSEDGFPVTPEQLACLLETLGDEAIAELIAGERLPNFAEFAALGICEVDIAELLSGG